jgi:hypothetical protein
MPLIKVYNNDSDSYGLKGHSIFKSVRPFIFGYAVITKLHEWCLRHHVRAASDEAVSFRRTFDDEAWSQQYYYSNRISRAIKAKTHQASHLCQPGQQIDMDFRETYLVS